MAETEFSGDITVCILLGGLNTKIHVVIAAYTFWRVTVYEVGVFTNPISPLATVSIPKKSFSLFRIHQINYVLFNIKLHTGIYVILFYPCLITFHLGLFSATNHLRRP